MRDGSIYELDIASGNKKTIMESHSDGELWGLACADDTHVVTSADDNKIKCWDITARKCIANGVISTESRKAARGGASSLTELPDSQCARGLAYNPSSKHIAVGHNDGTVTIRASYDKLD